ncbi:hypothetical protein B0A55_08048 [Friedmanniomyces simplex]|uniref:AB hydrolase-1 domain-containing protein n=1 Tax=Friedmanniomyces simplex TaxID=329884 RepID=A0A4U0XGM8_9PEZI|nr:hypothetical protein B0A55_08048 [Friedmanniomyces simplex]
MAAAQMPAIVIVPGSWHTPAHAEPLKQALNQQGYEAEAHQLASTGLKDPRPTFADDVSTIYKAVTAKLDQGYDVCLVLHSFAGVPGAEAVNRLTKEGRLEATGSSAKLVRVIFIAAYVFPVGFIMDAKLMLGPENPRFSIDANEMNNMADTRLVLFNDLTSDDEAQQWIDKLEPAYYLGKGPVISSDDWRMAPITVVTTRQDLAIPPERQEMVWQGFPLIWLDAGHTPYISQPERVAEIVVAALSET